MKGNEIGKIVVDAAGKVHSALGPGLLESVYEVVAGDGVGEMKDGIKRMINGLEDEKLGVFGSLRESTRNGTHQTVISTPSRCASLREIPRR